MSSDSAREACLKALERSRRAGLWSTASIDAVITEYKLPHRSAALASGIFLGVLQNMYLCDFYIDSFCRAPSKLEPKVRDILRCGVYQLLFMDRIPSNAAVNESVELCKKQGYARAAGLCNAILRKIAASKDSLPEVPGKGTAEYLSVRYSHPLWLCEELAGEYGYDFAEGFLAANNTAAKTTVQVNTLKTDTDKLLSLFAENGAAAEKHLWLPDCLSVKGKVSELYGFDEGLFYVQDPAAKCAVLAADVKPGMRVFDACAAPGGKSFASAISMNNSGSILSRDLHEKKLHLITEGAERLGIDIISTEAKDAREPLQEKFDVIIADVPCSGYGVIRKKPEIRYKPEGERATLPEIQLAILKNLSSSVAQGGVLLYSTCTVFKQENEDVISGFLPENGNFEAEDFELPGGLRSSGGMLRLWPHINGTDGFFICKLRRKV